MTEKEQFKKVAALAAVREITDQHTIIGVGTGSTVAYFIGALGQMKHQIEGCVASSEQTKAQLKAAGLPVMTLAAASTLPVYIDGADEVTKQRTMIKGGGGALTHEKIIATAAKTFICIVDESKLVGRLGRFPVAVEVLPIARSFVARKIVALGGDPVYREDFTTDSGNQILDVFNLNLDEPIRMEESIQLIPGVVECGIFAKRLADKVIVAGAGGTSVF